ncbi:hypothetical protein H7A76_19100 [Pseudomonas sp. MSSRFD41]|uniref:hypothetical protein n=1 Tax=Pseudomonas sp. MSSRFD41 TaxID=1310370 RepID=UPI00163ACE56|nr:hypothetical protein [Pseudomonas sp. MSSRFD41]MBC2657547.1 hypothetical protein [Pseudomonas sp. MSSRFD41]
MLTELIESMRTRNDGRSPSHALPDFSLTTQSASAHSPAPWRRSWVIHFQKTDHFRHFLPGNSSAKKAVQTLNNRSSAKRVLAVNGQKASFLFDKTIPFV